MQLSSQAPRDLISNDQSRKIKRKKRETQERKKFGYSKKKRKDKQVKKYGIQCIKILSFFFLFLPSAFNSYNKHINLFLSTLTTNSIISKRKNSDIRKLFNPFQRAHLVVRQQKNFCFLIRSINRSNLKEIKWDIHKINELKQNDTSERKNRRRNSRDALYRKYRERSMNEIYKNHEKINISRKRWLNTQKRFHILALWYDFVKIL